MEKKGQLALLESCFKDWSSVNFKNVELIGDSYFEDGKFGVGNIANCAAGNKDRIKLL